MPPPHNRFASGAAGGLYHGGFPHGGHQSHGASSHGGPPQQLGAGGNAYMSPGGGGASVGASNHLAAAFAANGGVLGLNGASIGSGAFAGDSSTAGLGGHAGRMGFSHPGAGASVATPAGVLAHHSQTHSQRSSAGVLSEHARVTPAPKNGIRDVWKHNLYENMALLGSLVDEFPYVAMVSYTFFRSSLPLPFRFSNHSVIMGRTRSSLESWQGRWAASAESQTITTNVCA